MPRVRKSDFKGKDTSNEKYFYVMEGFNIINLNASRICNAEKLKCLSDFIETYSPSIVCIQEVNIRASLREFSRNYQVYVNTSWG